VTVIHYAEGLTDWQAADAVRRCIDVKYALSLDLTDLGFHFSILSEFRRRLLAHGAEHRLFEILLEQGRAHGWLKARGKQRADSTHVLAAIRTLNRLDSVQYPAKYRAIGLHRLLIAANEDGLQQDALSRESLHLGTHEVRIILRQFGIKERYKQPEFIRRARRQPRSRSKSIHPRDAALGAG
jgi:hypothetical protein